MTDSDYLQYRLLILSKTDSSNVHDVTVLLSCILHWNNLAKSYKSKGNIKRHEHCLKEIEEVKMEIGKLLLKNSSRK